MRSLRPSLPLLIALCMLVAQSSFAQAPREKVDNEMIARIKKEGLEKSQVMDTISFLTDVYGPRLTGSPMTKTAGEWTRSKLTEWGLENAHLEPWGPFGRGWTLEGFSANMVAPNFTPLIACPKAWTRATPKAVRGEPVYLEASTEADLEKYRGKLHRAIVLMGSPRDLKALFDAPARRQTDEALLALANADGAYSRSRSSSSSSNPSSSSNTKAGIPMPPPASPFDRSALALQSKKWQMIYDEGAAVVLEPGRGDGGTLFVQSASLPTRGGPSAANRPGETPEKPAEGAEQPAAPGEGGSRGRLSVWSKDAPEVVPQVVVAAEHYNRIVRMIKKGAPVQLEVDIACRYHDDDLMSFNVIAEIPGTDLKDEVVMLGAHFDSWHSGTGATDNAVGCGVALEAVRILKALDAKPRRTIRIALWTGEEQGLFGSRAYVADHFGKAITPPSRGAPSVASSEKTEAPAAPKEGEEPAKPNPPANEAPRQSPRERVTKYELKPEHEKLSAYFNLDNGTGKIRGVYLQNNEALRPIFRAWLAPFTDMGASTVSLANTGGTDHLSFDAVGLPGFQFIQDPLEYSTRTHHSSMDVYDRVQEDDMKQASIIMASFIYHTAMRDEKLPRKPLVGEVTQAPAK